MSITSPRYYVNAQTQATPINIVTGTDALTGGTISRVDRGSGVMVFRCSGANSTASYTALTTNSNGVWEPPDLPIVFAVRAVVQAVPSGSFQRFISFCIGNDNENGFTLRKNGADNAQQLRNYLDGDLQAIGNPWGGGVLTTVVVRLVPAVGGADHADVWIETVGRSGSAPDFTSPGTTYTEYRMLLDSCVVSPGTGTFDIARLALYAPEALSDADCAALADDFDGTISPSGIGNATSINGISAALISAINGIAKASIASRNGV